MSYLVEYLKLSEKADEVAVKDRDFEKYNQLARVANALRENFTLEDWQYLIDHTPNKTAQIEYSRMKLEAEARKK